MDDIIKQLEACHDAIKHLFWGVDSVVRYEWEENYETALDAHRALIDRLQTKCGCPLELAGISDLGECTFHHAGDKCVFAPEGE